MQLPTHADDQRLEDLADRLRAIEPAVPDGCDASRIDHDRGRMIAAIIGIFLATKEFIESLLAYKRNWPKGRNGRWLSAFKLIAEFQGSGWRTIYRMIRAITKGCATTRKPRRKVKESNERSTDREDERESGVRSNSNREMKVSSGTTHQYKDEFAHVMARKLNAAVKDESTTDVVGKVVRMIKRKLPTDGMGRGEEGRKILIAVASELGIVLPD